MRYSEERSSAVFISHKGALVFMMILGKWVVIAFWTIESAHA